MLKDKESKRVNKKKILSIFYLENKKKRIKRRIIYVVLCETTFLESVEPAHIEEENIPNDK